MRKQNVILLIHWTSIESFFPWSGSELPPYYDLPIFSFHSDTKWRRAGDYQGYSKLHKSNDGKRYAKSEKWGGTKKPSKVKRARDIPEREGSRAGRLKPSVLTEKRSVALGGVHTSIKW